MSDKENKSAVATAKPKKKKKRKSHIGLIIALTLVTILVIIPVGFFGIFILDYSTTTVPEGNLEVDTIKNKMILQSLNHIGDKTIDGKDNEDYAQLKLDSDQDMINEVFSFLVNKINKKDFLPKMYVQIDGSNYIFYVEVKAAFLQTRLSVDTTIVVGDEDLTFNINAIRIGKFKLPDSIINFILDKVNFNETKIQETIRNAGFNVTVSLKGDQKYFKYNKNDFFNDIGSIINSSKNLYSQLIFGLLKSDTLKFSTENKISLKLNLTDFHIVSDDQGNDLNINYNKETTPKINFDGIKKNLTNIITDNKTYFYDGEYLKLNETKMLYQYLLRGYSYYIEEVEERKTIYDFVSKLDFKSYSSNDTSPSFKDVEGDAALKSSIKDINEASTLYIDTQEKATEAALKINDGEKATVITLDETKLNEYLRTAPIVGYSSMAAGTINVGTDKKEDIIDYLTIDNLNVNFLSKEQIDLFCTFNINGYYITINAKLKVRMKNKSSSNADGFLLPYVDFVIDNSSIKIGNKKVEDLDGALGENFISIISNNFVKGLKDEIKIVSEEVVTEEGTTKTETSMRFDLNEIAKIVDNKKTLDAFNSTLIEGFEITPQYNVATEDDTFKITVSKTTN